MQAKDKLGKTGEDEACLFLSRQGKIIVARNLRLGNLEIDIIVENKGEYEIIEVKSRATSRYGTASDAITSRKIKNLKRAALLYALTNKISLERMTISFIAIDYNNNLANIKYFYNILG